MSDTWLPDGIRPFRILGVQQLALGSRDRNTRRKLWIDCLGLRSLGVYRSEAENVDEEMLALRHGSTQIEVDLMQPIDSTRKPTIHEPALHHVGLWVDDLRSAACWLILHGVRLTPGGIRTGGSGHDVCFIHPRPSAFFPISGDGVLIELVQAPPDVISSLQML